MKIRLAILMLVLLKIVYECIVLNESSLKQFNLEVKSCFPFFEMTLLTLPQILNSCV